MAQWIARQTSNLKVVGSTPIRGVLYILAPSLAIPDNHAPVYITRNISHGSSVGRAGDCNSDSAVIPRPVVRFRPVRFFCALM